MLVVNVRCSTLKISTVGDEIVVNFECSAGSMVFRGGTIINRSLLVRCKYLAGPYETLHIYVMQSKKVGISEKRYHFLGVLSRVRSAASLGDW